MNGLVPVCKLVVLVLSGLLQLALELGKPITISSGLSENLGLNHSKIIGVIISWAGFLGIFA